MKKLLLISILLLSLFAYYSCSSDDDNKDYTATVEYSSNSDDFPVYIRGNGVNYKYIKKFHKETVTLTPNREYSFSASCEDKKTLLSIKLFDARGKLIKEASANQWVIIREPGK